MRCGAPGNRDAPPGFLLVRASVCPADTQFFDEALEIGALDARLPCRFGNIAAVALQQRREVAALEGVDNLVLFVLERAGGAVSGAARPERPACGVGLGLAVALNLDVIVPAIESMMGVQFLPKEIYFISSMPSDPRASDIVPIAVLSFLMSLAATVYPSWRAARIHPAEALRYE